MPEPYGQNTGQDLDIIASIVFSEVSENPKIFEADAKGLAGVIKNRILKTGNIESSSNPIDFPGLLSDKYERARGRQFKGRLEERRFKRIIQLTSGIVSNSIPDPTNGADSLMRSKKKQKGTYFSGEHIFFSSESTETLKEAEK